MRLLLEATKDNCSYALLDVSKETLELLRKALGIQHQVYAFNTEDEEVHNTKLIENITRMLGDEFALWP